jgi:LuxR family transcriptional regulator, maltose regulon positive regulatory protein
MQVDGVRRSPRNGGSIGMTIARGSRLDALPIIEAKLHPVTAAQGSVDRSRIVDRLLDPDAPMLVTLAAPAGYGKTTVLAQWVERESRPVAWLTVDSADNDPTVFVTYLASALARIGDVDRSLLRATTMAHSRILSFAVPRLLADIHRWPQPAVLVIDDAHRLTDPTSLDALAMFATHLPPGFHLAVAGRVAPRLPVARLRAERRVLEIDASTLALDEQETAALTAATGWPLSTEEASALVARTEGWAAGIYLATLAHERGEPDTGWTSAVSGVDEPIADYLRSEVGHRIDDEDMTVLTRSAVLELLEPRAVEAVTGRTDAADRLETLAAQNLFIQAVGRDGRSFRYHKLLRDFLLAELERREPGKTIELHRAAATWAAGSGSLDLAIHHSLAAGDRTDAALLVASHGVVAFQTGDFVTLERWLGAFEVEDFEALPQLALLGAWAYTMTGRGDDAIRLAELADRVSADGMDPDQARAFEARRAMTRAAMCRRGPRGMLADAQLAVAREPASGRWLTHALWLEGSAHYLLGDLDAAEAALQASTREAQAIESPNLAPLTLLASIRLRQQDWAGAEQLTREASARLEQFGYGDLVMGLGIYALQARIAAHRGEVQAARAALVRAQLVRPLASRAAPAYAVGSLVELARGYLAMSDPAGAQIVVREAEEIVRRTPSLGILTDELIEVRRYLSGAATALVGSSALTSAELRILPFLPTYLSFPEIADRLSISRNTVKTHAMSIYGKLWASSRGEAVERAVELGLLEPYPGLESIRSATR